MSIIRIVAEDPAPRKPHDDLIVWQVPENSRAHELLVEMLNARGIEWAVIAFVPRARKKKVE